MRLCRFANARLGVVEGSNVSDVTAALIAHLDQVAQQIRTTAPESRVAPLAWLTLVSPVAFGRSAVSRGLPLVQTRLVPGVGLEPTLSLRKKGF